MANEERFIDPEKGGVIYSAPVNTMLCPDPGHVWGDSVGRGRSDDMRAWRIHQCQMCGLVRATVIPDADDDL